MQKWGKPEDVIAQRFSKDDIKGMFTKEVSLANDEICIAERNGQILKEFGAGKHPLPGNFTDAVLIDAGTKKMKKIVENLLTLDDYTVAAEVEIRFKIYYPEKFSRNLFSNKILLTIDDLYVELYNEFFAKAISPIIRKVGVNDLYGNREVIEKVAASFEIELKKILEMWGIELVTLSLIWKFPDDYLAYLKSSSARQLGYKQKEQEYDEDVKEAVREQDLERLGGSKQDTLEATKSKMEKEYVEKEMRLQMEKKESQKDMEDAVEGLKLKEIMDKQKLAKKAKAKELGVREDEEK